MHLDFQTFVQALVPTVARDMVYALGRAALPAPCTDLFIKVCPVLLKLKKRYMESTGHL